MKKRSVLAIFVLLLAGCGRFAGVNENYQFDQSSKNGMVILGLSQNQPSDIVMGMFNLQDYVVRILPIKEDNTLQKQFNRVGLNINKAGMEYFVFPLSPNDYVFESATTGDTNRKYRTCMSGSTFRFSVKPGEILYLGNLHYEHIKNRPGPLVHKGFSNNETIKSLLRKYPGIKGQVKNADLIPETFVRQTGLPGWCGVKHYGDDY